MLQTLRENVAVKKVVLWLVVLGMVSGIGIGVTAVYDSLVSGRGTAAPGGPWAMMIAGQAVTPAMVQNEIRRVARDYGERGQNEIPGFEKQVQFEAVNNLVRRTLEQQEARKAGLSVSDQEVSDYIVSMPQLQRDGRFVGREQYKALIARSEQEVTAFENEIRDSILVGKWRALVGAGAVVTDREVEEEFRKRNEKVRFDYVSLDPAKYQPSTLPTDPEVKTFYEAHPEKYQRGEGRRARYVLVGETSAGSVPAPTDEEIRKAYEADRTKYTGSFEQSREEISRQIVFQRQQSEIDRRASEFRSQVSGAEGLDASATKAGLPVEDTGVAYRDPDGLSRLGPEFIEALFRAPKGSVMGPAKMIRGSAVFVLTEIQPPHRATIAEARVELLTDINREKSRDAALAAARKSASTSRGGLTEIARALGATVKSIALVGRGEPLGELGYDPAVENAAFGSSPGHAAEPVATSNGAAVVLEVLEKKTPDPSLLAADREKIRNDLRRGREFQLVNSFLEAAHKKSEFKTNEEYFKQFGS